jgi:diguanylate cyclase (GGDEF)-like protein/PAS domain S-box-containing protein
MGNKLKDYIDTFEFLSPNPIVVLDKNYHKVYSSETCEEETLKIFIKHLKKSNEDDFRIKLENGNIFSSSLVTIVSEMYYLVSIERIDSNPHNFEDPILKKISFFLDNVPDGVAILKNDEVIFRNDVLLDLIGMPKEMKDSVHYSKYIRDESLNKLRNIIKKDKDGDLILELNPESGGKLWIAANFRLVKMDNNRYHVVSIKDITSQQLLSNKHFSDKEHLSLTIESIKEGVIIFSEKNIITLFNSRASSISGINVENALNKNVDEIIRIIDNEDRLVDYLSKNDYKNEDVLILSEDGLFRHVSISVSNILNKDGESQGKVMVIVDISEAKKREKEILYLSYHDILTGIYNRTYLDFELKRLDTKRQLPFAIIMGDVNGLKITNDVFGHEAGDQLLKKVAEVLKHSCRQEDIIGRWGGDEFIVLLPNTTDEEAHILLRRIMREFEQLDQKDSINGLLPNMSLGYGVKLSEDEDIYETLKIAESNMYKRKMLSNESMHSSIIASMKVTLFEKSNETEEHTNRLYKNCYKIGRKFNLSDDEFNDLELVCLLHDIGKIGISDSILNKPEALNDEEWIEMKKHPEIGFRIAQATPELKKVAKYILYHHERFDGNGYPKGLKDFQIPLIDRILSVADAYDAMVNDRTYRKALSVEEAIQELISNSGTQFDPEIVKLFLEEIKEK